MSGKLPIDRARARKLSARPYEEHKQTFAEDQVKRIDEAGATAIPSDPASGERDEERNDA